MGLTATTEALVAELKTAYRQMSKEMK